MINDSPGIDIGKRLERQPSTLYFGIHLINTNAPNSKDLIISSCRMSWHGARQWHTVPIGHFGNVSAISTPDAVSSAIFSLE
jgi:hypothetical protein